MTKQPQPVFYGGYAKELGKVHRLSQTSFKEFVDKILNIPISLNVTRAEFVGKPKPERDRIKSVGYIVPCTFQSEHSERQLDKAKAVTLLCIDIDDSEAAMPYFNSPATLLDQLHPFNFAVYTTANSTAEAPRLRLIIEASHLPITSYRQATYYITQLIGLSVFNPESYTANLPMYLPTVFKEQPVDEHPLLISYTDGRAVKAEDLEGCTEEGFTPPTLDGGISIVDADALDFLRATTEQVTLDDAASALKHVSPDCSYPEWLEIAAALRHQFPLDPEADKAFNLFDEWSAGGSKYAGEKDTSSKWTSLRPNPTNRVPVTIRSLLRQAEAGGWDANPLQIRCYEATMKWIKVTAITDPHLLDTQGVARIANTPLLSNIRENALLLALKEAIEKQLDMPCSIGALRKDLAAASSALIKSKEDKESTTPNWAKGLCFMVESGVFFRPSVGEMYSPEAFDRAYGNKLLDGDKKRVMRPQDYVLDIIEIPRVYSTLYDPTQALDLFISVENQDFVNSYRRTYPEADIFTEDEAGMLFMEHIDLLIAEQDIRIAVVDYIAYIVQNPGGKVRWSFLIHGQEGCGKTLLADAMSAVLGVGNVKVVDSNAIKSAYNDWATGSQLVVLEEVRVAGHNRHDIMNTLKPLISNSRIGVTAKYKSSQDVPNYTNYILFTNHHDALAISEGNRRYCIVKSALQTKEQVKAIPVKHFDDLYDVIHKSPGGLRAFLLNWDISESFNPNGNAPATRYNGEMADDSASGPTLCLRQCIEDGDNALISEHMVFFNALMEVSDSNQHYGKLYAPTVVAALRGENYTRAGRFLLDDDTRHTVWIKVNPTESIGDAKDYANKRLSIHNAAEAADLL